VITLDLAASIVRRFAGLPIAIVGDVMLDEFIVGRVNRISPEAPVPVVEFDRDEYRAGGAANVAHNVRALGGEVELIGLVGHDASRERLIDELRGQGITTGGLVIDPGRRTTRKQRIVTTRNQQVARVDYENDTEAAGDVEAELAERVEECCRTANVIVVSDYLKGAVTRTIMATAVRAGHDRQRPVLVDPKIPHIDYYGGASLITPNHYEAETATHIRIRTDEDAARAARVFMDRARSASVLITRGEHGMCLFDGTRESHLPAVAREVADVTGAGDTVIATLALSLAAGATLHEAASLANHAAGVVVAKFGAATVTPEELLAAIADAGGTGFPNQP
jgi:D-beta-D-heptose 7-phosphate kinase/D-beta-D-heptose 1-phosphate adenosyltransferase